MPNFNAAKVSITIQYAFLIGKLYHTTYTRNNMGQKCEGNCGLWVLNEIIIYLFKYKTIETHARAFLPLNISAVGSVYQLLLLS